MTRIDAFSPQEREALKKEIKQEIRHDDRRKRLVGCGISFVIALVIIGVPLLYVASQVAKTGFVDVPVLSRTMYKPSEPLRTVIPLLGSKPEDIYRVVGTKIKYDPATSFASLPVTEVELTTIVQHAVQNAPPNTLPFPVRLVQVAVDPEYLEIYAVSPQKKRDATVRVRIRPYVKGGELKVEVREIAIGALILPKKIGELMFTAFGALVTEETANAVQTIGRLVNIEFDQGIVKFVIIPNLH